jgi:hypothetical protein
MAHHRQRCAQIATACRRAPHSATDLLPVVFPRTLDEHQMGFAFGEVVAHIRYMLGRGDLVAVEAGDGMERVRAG